MGNDTLILIHRLIGYPTAFVIAPAALLAFTRPGVHRVWGKLYFYCMLFLYCTGLYFTFSLHEWSSWVFARNLAFNFFGFFMLILAYRAIRLFRTPGVSPAQASDRVLGSVLILAAAFVTAVAIWKNTPMKIFALLALWICFLEWRELKLPVWEKPLLFRRHQRYILASYFYVLTVVSIVHLKDEFRNNPRWLWPAAVGVPVIWLMTAAKERGKIGFLGRVPQGVLTRRVVWGVFGLSAVFGAYVVYDLLFGPPVVGQG